MSKLDRLYRRLLLTKFFVRGWGQPENLKRIFEFRKIISDRNQCQHLVPPDYPIHIDKDIIQKECRIIEGHFTSPFVNYLPGLMPKEVEKAHFQMILPKQWDTKLKPVCIQLAGTGDHFFWRRRSLLARPLLKEYGIASILLENPYYGLRKPKQQLRSCLHNVSDLFVMGGALVLESLALFHWCERQGYGPLGITGISMGGFMASLAATNWHKPLSLIPCLSWSTASSVFTRGVMSGAIPWKLLEDQYASDSIYKEEIRKLIVSPEEVRNSAAFELGQQFACGYPESIDTMKVLQDKYRQEISDEKHRLMDDQGIIGDTRNSEGQSAGVYQASASTTDTSSRAKFHTSSTHNKSASQTKPTQEMPLSPKKSGYTFTADSLRSMLHLSGPDSLFGLSNKITKNRSKELHNEALWFMRGVMDDCTHLGNFSCPLDPSLIIIVAAERDAYVPRDSVLSLLDIWPGANVRYIDSGHISAFLFRQTVFRKAIADAFDKQTKKYYS